MPGTTRRLREERFEGIGVCNGVAIGAAFLVDDPRGRVLRVFLPPEEIEAEVARLHQAVQAAQQQLQDARKRLQDALGDEYAWILEAHLLLLQDSSFIRQIEQFIRERRANAEWAVKDVTRKLLDVYATISDEYLRERSSDITDVTNRLIRILAGTKPRDLSALAQEAIIVADDLLPSVTAELDTGKVLGFVCNTGGPTSHTAIIARSLGIPAAVGLRNITSRVRSGETIIIDGSTGTVIVRPTPETLRFYSEQREREQQQLLRDLEERELPSITADGTKIALRANIELLDDTEPLHRYNAEGIGLYRSEFLYSQVQSGLPTEEEQFEVYKILAETSGAAGAVIRTFDLGGDKLRLEGFEEEPNPALGLRAIRLSLTIEEVFRTQLRAILRAAAFGNLKIVLPLISNLDELRSAKRIIAEVERELREQKIRHGEDIEIGVMVEVPAAVVMVETLAREADFFSLGTNDLIQYLLAVDRVNENVSRLYEPLHPAVLRAIKYAADAAHKTQIPLSVCGEMASNPAQVVVLLGLGIRDFSMTPAAIPQVRRIIRAVDLNQAREIAAHAISLTTPAEVNRYVQTQIARRWAHFLTPAPTFV
ncbi:MAG TPA: phosphoenolpyruvate--protein phosphotransferase [Blastocatellia bacterium]|nr:phosphoenolpyruvate--protein phosphotransferase [Blastocatellia bacterium]